MLDGLKENLGAALKKVLRSSTVDKELIDELAKDVQRALIQSDVKVGLILEVTERLKERALGEDLPPGFSRKNHLVKILHDELAGLLGGDSEFEFQSGKQNKVLLLGIQGSGKTTIASKLSRLLTRQGYKVGVIGADTYRPGALVQLRTMCEKAGVEVYGEEKNDDAVAVVGNGLRHFEREPLDIILIDTAGRHKQEQDLLDEMSRIGAVASPDMAMLVIDGTIGQQCFGQAEAFHKAIPVGGIIITKMDSSAKGGGALAAAAATGAHVMYIGTGERIDDLEKFSSSGFVGRLLGIGDVQAILEHFKRIEEESDEVRMKRIMGGKMNMEDYFYQLEEFTKSGSMRGMLENLPGFSGAGSDQLDKVDKLEENIERWRYIMQSMTPAEKADPDLIKNASRTQRIARGSGRPDSEVKNLLKTYKTSKNMMKAAKGRAMRDMLKRMGIG